MYKYIVYHGTGSEFQKFKCPAYFTDSQSTAIFFAKRHGNTPKIVTSVLSLENPLVVDIDGQSWGGFRLDDSQMQDACIKYIAAGDVDEEAYLSEEGLTVGFLADYAEFLGHDGLVLHNCYEEDDSIGTQYVVFDGSNIEITAVVAV